MHTSAKSLHGSEHSSGWLCKCDDNVSETSYVSCSIQSLAWDIILQKRLPGPHMWLIHLRWGAGQNGTLCIMSIDLVLQLCHWDLTEDLLLLQVAYMNSCIGHQALGNIDMCSSLKKKLLDVLYLHGIVDSHACSDDASRGIDIHANLPITK